MKMKDIIPEKHQDLVVAQTINLAMLAVFVLLIQTGYGLFELVRHAIVDGIDQHWASHLVWTGIAVWMLIRARHYIYYSWQMVKRNDTGH